MKGESIGCSLSTPAAR